MLDTVFLDRDGTINASPPAGEYVRTWDEFSFLPGVVEAVARLRTGGRRVVIATNQRGIALGRMTEADVAEIHRRMLAELGPVAAVYHCPHDIGRCLCRKPLPGMLLRAAARLGVDLARSAVVGDSTSDVRAGMAVGASAVKIGDPCAEPVDYLARSLPDAVEWILAR
jgi:D-glycero-D-manno-heptose 1,7-bisphosphate phosphatase